MEESAASSSSAHTSYASGGKGKEKMSPPEPEKREKEKSPSEATTLESAATMEVALQIKERDFKIKHLEEQLHKLELETKIKNEMAEKLARPPLEPNPASPLPHLPSSPSLNWQA